MSTRISIKDLQEMVDQINDITGHDKDPYDHSKKGCNPNTGTYLIDWKVDPGVSFKNNEFK